MTIDFAHSTRRPARISIYNWSGTTQTLPSGENAYDILTGGSDVLLLGCGPLPFEAAALADKFCPSSKQGRVSYVECADFASQMPQKWHEDIPAHWVKVSTTQDNNTNQTSALAQTSPQTSAIDHVRRCIQRGDTIIIYKQNARLFPDFWGPLLAAVQLERIRQTGGIQPKSQKNRSIILAGSASDLLVHEMHHAFSALGFAVRIMEPDNAAILPALLQEEQPQLFACVNFKGLDAWGERFHLLQAADVPVAVWCVDNPWHLLSGIKTPFWKKLHLFVTDNSFIPPLLKHGAMQVFHLPLATMPQLFSHHDNPTTPPSNTPTLSEKLIFVGRSAFPDKQRFFAGCRYPQEVMEEALQELASGKRPHYDWWCNKLGLSALWPEKTARVAGFATEETAQAWRTSCLTTCAQQLTAHEFAVYGDEGWRALLPPKTTVHPPVDYYTQLPALYSHAGAVLNLTSLLLPAGLTQRNFDVWAAGGLCLTDSTAGLSIFSDELVREICFTTPDQIIPMFKRATAEPVWRRDIIEAWRTHILSAHTYEHRVQTMLTACGIA